MGKLSLVNLFMFMFKLAKLSLAKLGEGKFWQNDVEPIKFDAVREGYVNMNILINFSNNILKTFRLYFTLEHFALINNATQYFYYYLLYLSILYYKYYL